MAAGVAGRFEGAEGAVREAGEDGGGVVDADGLLLAGGGVGALLDEGLGHGGEARDAAVDPERGVEAVGEEVAGDAGAGGLDVEAPGAGAALGDVGGDGPVLQELGAVVVDAAELAAVDHLLDEGDGGHAAVVVADEVGDAGLLDGGDHLLAFGGGAGEGLFGDDGLAGLGGGDGDLGVEVVRDADVDEVDVGAGDRACASRSRSIRSPSGRRRPWSSPRRGRRRP